MRFNSDSCIVIDWDSIFQRGKLKIEVQHPWVVGSVEDDINSTVLQDVNEVSDEKLKTESADADAESNGRKESKKKRKEPKKWLKRKQKGDKEKGTKVTETTTTAGGPNSESPNSKDQKILSHDYDTKHEKREFVMKEILETERSYVKLLKMVIDVFVLPLRRAALNHKIAPTYNILPTQVIEFTKDGVWTT